MARRAPFDATRVAPRPGTVRRLGGIAAAGAIALAAGSAHAQTQVMPTVLDTGIPFDLPVTERVTVLQRQHPETAALGVRTGSFLLFPQVLVEGGATDNVFGSANDTNSDVYTRIVPRIDARSQWSRHAVQAHAIGSFKKFATYSLKDENSGYDVGVDGRLDVVGDTNVRAAVNADRVYINQFSGDFPQFAAASVPLDRQVASLRGTYAFNRLQVVGDVNVSRLNYHDTTSIAGQRIDQDYLDRTVTRFIGRAEYNLTPVTSFFVQANYLIHDYRQASTLDRSGDELRFTAGAAFDITPLIRTRLGAGYLQRNYNQAGVSSLSGLALDLQLDYFLTQLTTISVAARRDVRDAVLPNSPGYTSTRGAVEVDHELFRNLILIARADYENDDYSRLNRKDTLFHVGAGATYTANRHLVIAPTIDYVDRGSSGTDLGQRFKEVRAAIGLTVRQ